MQLLKDEYLNFQYQTNILYYKKEIACSILYTIYHMAMLKKRIIHEGLPKKKFIQIFKTKCKTSLKLTLFRILFYFN